MQATAHALKLIHWMLLPACCVLVQHFLHTLTHFFAYFAVRNLTETTAAAPPQVKMKHLFSPLSLFSSYVLSYL
jgi:hypothetical protein